MSSSTESFTWDALFGGAVLPVPSKAEILELLQNLIRGTVLGKVLFAIGASAPDPGNTGEGDIEAVSLGAGRKVGTYTITCLTAGPPATWQVIAPDGHRLADAESEVAYVGEICFTIYAYGVGFAAGDIFTVEVEEGSGEVKIANHAAVDGTETIYGILAEDTDASAAAVDCPVYLGGEFSEDALTMSAGDTVDDYRDHGREIGIVFRKNVSPDEA